jgi:HD-GYP domain-containing protein (c-di-GMP phosphodiesterase class II)
MRALSPGTERALVGVAVALAGVAAVMVLVGGPGALVVIVLAAAVVAAIAAWARERREASTRTALEQQRRGQMDERARASEQGLRRQLDEQRESLRRERQLRVRTERARQAEREWARELREQVLRAYRGGQGSGDLHELVLEVAMRLSGARCGLLLSKSDRDGDGRLDLVCHIGFRNDPTRSSVAQRFAEKVLERDEIVREDSPGDGMSAADDEIESLVAVPVYMNDGFEGVVICANRRGGFEEIDDDVLLALGDHAGAVLENHRLQGRVRSSYLAVVGILADAMASTDLFFDANAAEVSDCAERVARRLGLEPSRREQILFAALLRDVGKLGISERVLLKPGRLTADERATVELHPEISARIVERVPGLAGLAPAIRHHHERWDGQGYPDGLRGEDIPLDARVVAVVDCVCALISTRPYRQALPLGEACAELERCAGTQFDAEIVSLFVDELQRLAPHLSDDRPAAPLPALVPAEEVLDAGRLGISSAAASDNVTLLHSHRHLFEVAAREAERSARSHQPFAVAIAELSELSMINLREGYAAGDLALQAAARLLERAAAGESATIGRYSGRRLALLLTGPDAPDRAAKLAADLERPDPAGPRLRLGVAAWEPGDRGEDVFARARLAVEAAAAAT